MCSFRKERQNRQERGATLVEGAIAATVLFLLLFAIVQFSFLVSTLIDARNASSAGARMARIVANDPTADFDTLRAAANAINLVPKSQVQKVVMFRATSATTPLPAECKVGSVLGLCNSYTSADFDRPVGQFGKGGVDGAWAPQERAVSRTSGTDYIGVSVIITSPDMTGILPITRTFAETTVTRIQATTD